MGSYLLFLFLLLVLFLFSFPLFPSPFCSFSAQKRTGSSKTRTSEFARISPNSIDTIFTSIALPAWTSAGLTNLLATITSRHAADSNAEPRALSKNRQRSGEVNFPFPSAMFKGTDCRGAIELVANRCTPGQSLQNRDRPRDELKGGLINFELFVVEGSVHCKRSKIRNTSKITNKNMNKIRIDRLVWSRRFSILILTPTPTLALSFLYGLISPPYQRKKRSPKKIQLTAPNAR
jgi:hypothetical protein